jgi:hypothetical protein
MTSINPPRDDEGVVRRRLQRAGTAPVGRIRRGAPAPAPRQAGGSGDDTAPGRRRTSSRARGPERRAGERRRRRVAVLLDTRSPLGNRRRRTRRGSDRTLPRRGSAIGGPSGARLDDDLYA